MLLRPPGADEGPALTELCLRSKATHGYSEAFIEACRSELTVNPTAPHVVVAELGGIAAGVAEITLVGGQAVLNKLFVEQAFQGQGIGRALFEWAKAKSQKCGARALVFDADPGAVTFYEKMGAVVRGSSPSGSIPGRFLPHLQLQFDTV